MNKFIHNITQNNTIIDIKDTIIDIKYSIIDSEHILTGQKRHKNDRLPYLDSSYLNMYTSIKNELSSFTFDT